MLSYVKRSLLLKLFPSANRADFTFFKPLNAKYLLLQVTGSGRGIGRYISLELATSGATVICWSKSPGPNEEVVREIRKRGGKAYAYSVDVSDRVAVTNAAEMVGVFKLMCNFWN